MQLVLRSKPHLRRAVRISNFKLFVSNEGRDISPFVLTLFSSKSAIKDGGATTRPLTPHSLALRKLNHRRTMCTINRIVASSNCRIDYGPNQIVVMLVFRRKKRMAENEKEGLNILHGY